MVGGLEGGGGRKRSVFPGRGFLCKGDKVHTYILNPAKAKTLHLGGVGGGGREGKFVSSVYGGKSSQIYIECTIIQFPSSHIYNPHPTRPFPRRRSATTLSLFADTYACIPLLDPRSP